MQVTVLFFGYLRESSGQASEVVEIASGATIAELLVDCARRRPALESYYDVMAVALNESYADRDTRLSEGDVVALIPPVSGGAPDEREPADNSAEARGTQHTRLVRDRIDTQTLLEAMKRGEDGAVVVFEGIVRNHTRGRRTLYLGYSAYEAMADKQMEELVRQALERFEVRDAAIVHRLGRLEIGEISVLIMVVAAHRGAAFDACHWLIDTLKKTVPIWKKEYFEDGAVWADGEAFPPEILRASGTRNENPASE